MFPLAVSYSSRRLTGGVGFVLPMLPRGAFALVLLFMQVTGTSVPMYSPRNVIYAVLWLSLLKQLTLSHF